jgi:hypothetical protein
MGERRGAYRVLVGKHKRKRPLGRPRCTEDNIKIDLQEVGWGGGMNWIGLAQWHLVNAVMNLRVP